ncbi:MAG TPA: hypothetical protein VIY52_23395 [Streptosporangiaceae bacterium]
MVAPASTELTTPAKITPNPATAIATAASHAVCEALHELSGDLPAAATAYADAARRATDVAERDHLVRQAARARAAELRFGP